MDKLQGAYIVTLSFCQEHHAVDVQHVCTNIICKHNGRSSTQVKFWSRRCVRLVWARGLLSFELVWGSSGTRPTPGIGRRVGHIGLDAASRSRRPGPDVAWQLTTPAQWLKGTRFRCSQEVVGSWSYPGGRRKHSIWSWVALPLFIVSPWRPTPTAQVRAQALVLQLELRCQTRASCGTSSRGASGAALILWPLGRSSVSRAYSPVLSCLLFLWPASYSPSSPASSLLQWRKAQGHVGGSFCSGLSGADQPRYRGGRAWYRNRTKILSRKNSISKRSWLLNCSVFCSWSS